MKKKTKSKDWLLGHEKIRNAYSPLKKRATIIAIITLQQKLFSILTPHHALPSSHHPSTILPKKSSTCFNSFHLYNKPSASSLPPNPPGKKKSYSKFIPNGPCP